ncbi:hypothetical protein GCM10009850_003730 [Nonomuraea monospora]|uniref:Homogentisate 1,2-dioxygenase n=1 Tax=Nonomuraea monospora TaxID=568818 RepID=A0ABN3C5G0_9ACTN
MIVHEVLDGLPYDSGTRLLRRQEHLLLTGPPAGPAALSPEPLETAHVPQEYVEQGFARPRRVYQNACLQVEWQQMHDFRQPFYHRNNDMDEIAFQITGECTVMTDLGSAVLRPGDFSRVPVGTAHDHYGVRDVHLAIDVLPPAREVGPVVRHAERLVPPFPGWEAGIVTEFVTASHQGVASFLIDERLLLEQASPEEGTIAIQRADAPGTTWLYRSAHVWVGNVRLDGADGSLYRRHRTADEVQYQISGRRRLVTQRGTLDLEPGDLVHIPVGCAFTDVCAGPSAHISVVSGQAVTRVAGP